jgi:hypothetical protein
VGKSAVRSRRWPLALLALAYGVAGAVMGATGHHLAAAATSLIGVALVLVVWREA